MSETALKNISISARVNGYTAQRFYADEFSDELVFQTSAKLKKFVKEAIQEMEDDNFPKETK